MFSNNLGYPISGGAPGGYAGPVADPMGPVVDLGFWEGVLRPASGQNAVAPAATGRIERMYRTQLNHPMPELAISPYVINWGTWGP